MSEKTIDSTVILLTLLEKDAVIRAQNETIQMIVSKVKELETQIEDLKQQKDKNKK